MACLRKPLRLTELAKGLREAFPDIVTCDMVHYLGIKIDLEKSIFLVELGFY